MNKSINFELISKAIYKHLELEIRADELQKANEYLVSIFNKKSIDYIFDINSKKFSVNIVKDIAGIDFERHFYQILHDLNNNKLFYKLIIRSYFLKKNININFRIYTNGVIDAIFIS